MLALNVVVSKWKVEVDKVRDDHTVEKGILYLEMTRTET
jgi:hypothetical protein